MMQIQMFEPYDVFATTNDVDGVIRVWRVTNDGSLVEYEGWPVDARTNREDGGER